MKEKIKESLKWIFFGRQFHFALSMVFQLLIMRLLSPKIYGVYALAVSSLGFVALFISFGFSHSIIQFQKIKNIEKNVLGLSVLQSCVFVCLTLPAFFIVRSVYGVHIARVYLVLILAHAITFISLVFQFTIERDLDFKKTEIVLAIAKLLSVLTILWLAWRGFGVYSLVAGFYVKVLLEALIFFKYSGWRYGIGWEREVIRTIVVYASKRFLTLGCGAMMGYLDKLILGLVVPIAYVGAYERAYFIIASVQGLVGQINSQFAYSLLNRIKDDFRKTVLLINKGVFVNIVLASAFTLVLLFYLKVMVIQLLGDKWVVTAQLIPYFSVFLMANIPTIFVRQVFYAVKDPLHIVWGRLMEIGFFISMSLLLYKTGKLSDHTMALNLGVSTAIGAGFLIIILLRDRLLKFVTIFKPILITSSVCAIGVILATITDLSPLVKMIIVAAIYGLLLWKFCRRDFLWFKSYWQT
jgi:O-antigen/teichoic acid export membrane protein